MRLVLVLQCAASLAGAAPLAVCVYALAQSAQIDMWHDAIREREKIVGPFREREARAYSAWTTCTETRENWVERENWIERLNSCQTELAEFKRALRESERVEAEHPFPKRPNEP